jgi:hypothetical protein
MNVMPSEFSIRGTDSVFCEIESAVRDFSLLPVPFPINEIGIPLEKSLKDLHYWHVGCSGDQVSWSSSAIMHFCQSQFPADFQKTFKQTKGYLARHGIGISYERWKNLSLVIHGSEDFEGELHFSAHVYPGISDLPFDHRYSKSAFSEDLLYNDIAKTLRSIFDILPPPDQLWLTVETSKGKPGYYHEIPRRLNESHEFPFEINTISRKKEQ